FGDTALHCACASGCKETIAALLRGGADLSLENNGGDTAMHVASLHSRTEMMEALLQGGADVNAKDE
ncbi:Serine/threonine-protein kinase TNNI3K, partial [Tetrabaena socialis]